MNTNAYSGKSWEVSTKATQSGMFISEFSLSVYDGKDKETQKAKYFNVNCKCFGQLAENVGNLVQKQDELIVSGRMTVETWDKDGVKQYKNVLIIDEIGKSISKFAPRQGEQPTGQNMAGGYNVTGMGSDVTGEVTDW